MRLPDHIALRILTQDAHADPPLATLSDAERAQLSAFGSAQRRRAFALGRAAARSLLAEHLAVPENEIGLRVADDGAPELDGSDLQVSISHVATATETHAVAVVAPHPVGVDLELIRPRRPDLYRFLLAPEDYGLLDELPHAHDEAQVLIWTLKEAVLKALRTGFRLSPKKLRLSIEPEVGRARVALSDGTLWQLCYGERSGCYLAVAYQADGDSDHDISVID